MHYNKHVLISISQQSGWINRTPNNYIPGLKLTEYPESLTYRKNF